MCTLLFVKPFETIDEALDYLYSFINYETDLSYSYGSVHYNIERTVRLLERAGSPHEGMKIIHVAGTKGKGSVCRILSAILSAQGIKTGLFTSPHLEWVNERIEVSGDRIEDREIVSLLNDLRPAIDDFPMPSKPTTFEILTLLAIVYFRRRNVEWSVLETGMGGRFDSTNFAVPEVSVITPVSLDHTDKLGTTAELIAYEKAGIIKDRRPAVIGYQPYPVSGVFVRRAEETKSPLLFVQERCSYEIGAMGEEGTRFSVSVDGVRFRDLFLTLAGEHQVQNAVTAMLALKTIGMLPGEACVREALGKIFFPGRLELITRDRRFLLDSAHNKDSARVLAAAVRGIYRYERLFSIIGIVKGKDIDGIVRHVASVSDGLVVSEPVTHKPVDTAYVYETAKKYFPACGLEPDLKKAIDGTVCVSTPRDLVLITGSFYTTAPARSYLLSRRGGGL
ncbi:MAG: bifunctional folylpolyglutamate synthase/dihydrofolate synthase [Spirochaetes bacterium]|nr:bifunctional folylpolyglutamate synthase/dihydrofolate synthase [Spirochaetota bacterium]